MIFSFAVGTTSRFDRLVRALHKRHRELADYYEEAIAILSADPHNQSRRYHIRKLEGVSQGDGRYRLSLGRWRFRYDISDEKVILQYCGLRREDTYRS